MRNFAGEGVGGALAQVVDGMDDAVIVRETASGEVVAANAAAAETFGDESGTRRELDAEACAANPERAAEARREAERAARQGGAGRFRWEARRRDGTTFWAESSVSATTVGDREYLVSVVRDVTERTERERDLERFAEILTHDLTSPLNAAQAQVNILREEVSGGEEFLDRLERVHDRMEAIVGDVRALVGDKRHEPDLGPVDLNRVVVGAWEAVGGCGDDDEPVCAEDAGGSLIVDGDLGTVTADEGRLCRLFENLFQNAIRHAGEAGDCVTVTVSSIPGGVAVDDDGSGVPEADRERVFEYGYTTADAGTGFGLNIVAATAEAHGWDVAVGDSEAGGARFEITGMRGSSDGG
ncbi:sensor histidine kinase [Halobellus litoreus]|uniref:histidine kinase n=1 Tax=Halobellus litoreus TaxID=755310 RepID=A0ABD6DSZ4_9EURY|nr:PAS domain-containing sensor histidine kinase [Halobellus litoreus]